jgi:hypothetical protein
MWEWDVVMLVKDLFASLFCLIVIGFAVYRLHAKREQKQKYE